MLDSPYRHKGGTLQIGVSGEATLAATSVSRGRARPDTLAAFILRRLMSPPTAMDITQANGISQAYEANHG